MPHGTPQRTLPLPVWKKQYETVMTHSALYSIAYLTSANSGRSYVLLPFSNEGKLRTAAGSGFGWTPRTIEHTKYWTGHADDRHVPAVNYLTAYHTAHRSPYTQGVRD